MRSIEPPSAMSRRNGGVYHLPEEILGEILIRLPVKSIGKSRCVSKHWNILLTTPRFINTHLARSHQKNLLILRNFNSLFTFTLRPDGVAEGTFENPNSIPTLDKDFRLIGHCNGLVLIGTERVGGRSPDYLLMNPTTLEHLRLPPTPSYSYSASYKRVVRLGIEYGLGYDSVSDDYKAVQLCVLCNVTDRPLDRYLDPEFCFIFAEVYSFKKKCWNRVNIDHRPFSANGATEGPGVFLNGALHWVCSDPDTIIAFDLATEKCYEIPSLGDREHNYMMRLTTFSKGSCLGIVCSGQDDEARIEIWTMKEYGIAESWTKSVYVIEGSEDMIGKMPWFWRDALVIQYPYKLTFYDFNDEKSFDMALETTTIFHDNLTPLEDGETVDVEKDYLIDGLMFTESLVSPLSL